MTIGYFEQQIPGFLQKLGCFEFGKNGLRFRNGLEIARTKQIALHLCVFSEGKRSLHIALGPWQAFIPAGHSKHKAEEILDRWGFAFHYDADWTNFRFSWGNKTKSLHMPWELKWHSTEIMLRDGSWRPAKRISILGAEKIPEYDCSQNPLPDVHVERHPYYYLLPDGSTQIRTATVTVERWTWRRFKRLRFFAKTRQSIEVWFNDEVGERAGSWKGGCLGCSYEMKSGETPRMTLARMQKERRFR